ncbi:Hypothetical protein Nlim_1813 [Candidatus Nitrosarchaeum limnium SFB1]|uniref:Uncharacterized protein n=1 Tax=Candidatus Nitrosarchaeum limnium SFB1 TaxID=886738 RepID=F3KMR2_9ARCH|nr:Hypothetical protein Nlim_1813 [Candidatus Nitrosarchaeum limnium SFB1]
MFFKDHTNVHDRIINPELILIPKSSGFEHENLKTKSMLL